MRVLIIGPSIERTKGGMATVINDMLQNSNEAVQFYHIVSHVEGSGSEKLRYTAKSLGALIREKQYDVVHIHVASGASFYRKSLFVLACKAMYKPVILHVHGADFDSFYHQSSALSRTYIRRIFSMCGAVVVLSQYWKDFFQNNIPSRRIEVLHNGVYTRVFRECFTAPANLNAFLFLGRLGQRKGVYDLLEAIEHLVNAEGMRQLQFYLAGDGDIEQVRQLVAAKKLESNVKLLGWLNGGQKLEWFKKVDTIVLPSYNEGLPMAILEAMAAGKIIISSKVGGIPDLVTEGQNGFLITPGDVEQLQRYIVQVATSPAEMVRIAEENRRKIEEEYNLETIHQQLITLYKQLVAGKHAATVK